MSRILIFALAVLSLSMTAPVEPLNAGPAITNQAAIDGEAFDRALVAQMIKDQQEAREAGR